MNTRILISFVGLFSSGCTELLDKDFLQGLMPSVEFSGLNVGYVDFEQIETDFVFSVDNPNPVGFSIHDFDYALAFSDIEWVSGEDPDGLMLNPDKESEMSLPVDIIFTDLYDMIQASRGADALPFGVQGNFGILLDESSIVMDSSQSNVSEASSGDYIVNLPYDAGGSFPALRKPDFQFQKIEVAELNLDSVRFDLVLDVENEHASNLTFTRFDYALDLGTASLIEGVVDNLDEVIHGVDESNENKELRIPIQVDTLQSATALYGILVGGQNLDIGFEAISDVDTPFGLVELSMDENGNISID
jgi:LEA14-like dessication related protein